LKVQRHLRKSGSLFGKANRIKRLKNNSYDRNIS
jgi:hypothetical protein